jgi:AraC family transcriptional regulator
VVARCKQRGCFGLGFGAEDRAFVCTRFQNPDAKCVLRDRSIAGRHDRGRIEPMRGSKPGLREAATNRPYRVCVAGAWVAELLRRSPYCVSYRLDAPVIGFAFDPQAGVHAFGGARRRDFRALANSLAYVPPGCDVYSASDAGGEYLRIVLMAAREGEWQKAHRFGDVIDRQATAAARGLRRMLLGSENPDALEVERMLLLLESRARVAIGGARSSATVRWMTPARWRRIDALIEARLNGSLSVRELAGTLGLSTGFFSRAFREATGQAPHDYLIDRRISHARMLLSDRRLGLASIASASGFASHAHMSMTFRKRLGVTPNALRPERVPLEPR